MYCGLSPCALFMSGSAHFYGVDEGKRKDTKQLN
jgi:hypothetical protein